MKILINCSTLKKGGAIQVGHSFIHELNNFYSDYTIVVCSSALYNQLDLRSFNNNFKFLKHDTTPSIFGVFVGKNRHLDNVVYKNKIERVFTVFGPSYWRPKVPHLCGYAKPQYIFKNSPFFANQKNIDRLKIFLREKIQLFDFKKNNDSIVTENPIVTKLLNNKIDKDIYTVTNYYNQVFDKKVSKKFNYIKGIEGYKFLTVSSNYPHKNLKIIDPLIDYLKNNYPGYKFNFILTLDKNDIKISENNKPYVTFLGNVKIEDCPSLYNNCDFMFLPTLLECFSASYCEAMKMELPILTSDLDFARGICDKAAVYFDPTSVKSIAESFINLSSDLNKQNDLIIKGQNRLLTLDNFSQRAKKYIKILTNENINSKFEIWKDRYC